MNRQTLLRPRVIPMQTSSLSVRTHCYLRSIYVTNGYFPGLLAPLTSAAELPTHPSMSIPYRSQVLGELVKQAREMVHKERQTLWGVKHLATKFRGDHGWITSEVLRLDGDASLFGNNKIPHPHDSTASKAPRQPGPLSEFMHLGNIGPLSDEKTSNHPDCTTEQDRLSRNSDSIRRNSTQGVPRLPESKALIVYTPQSARTPTDSSVAANAAFINAPENLESSEAENRGVTGYSIIDSDIPKSPETITIERPKEYSIELGLQSNGSTDLVCGAAPQDDSSKPSPSAQFPPGDIQEESTQIPTHRMRTRAQAQALSDKATSTSTRTPSNEPITLPDIHPLYLIPSSAIPDRDFGLPPTEAEETRCIIMLWIQKQEEICRSADRLYAGLLKSDRMRKTVLSWCNAEGHLGELSDGEDWYDKEEWGLEDELKKGQLEEDDDAANQGKKTRRRAQ